MKLRRRSFPYDLNVGCARPIDGVVFPAKPSHIGKVATR